MTIEGLLIDLTLGFVGLFLLYWVIRSAIDSSETARNIKIIIKQIQENENNKEN